MSWIDTGSDWSTSLLTGSPDEYWWPRWPWSKPVRYAQYWPRKLLFSPRSRRSWARSLANIGPLANGMMVWTGSPGRSRINKKVKKLTTSSTIASWNRRRAMNRRSSVRIPVVR